MKKIPTLIILFWFATIPAAHPQQSGVVEGRLVNLTDPSIVAQGADIEVIELSSGMSIIRSATTDASGKFLISGLPADRRLMIRATYKGANYHSQMAFSAGKANVEIGVYEPTASMKDIEVTSVSMAFQLTGGQLKALETVTINNKTRPPRVYTTPEGSFRISKAPGILQPPQIRVTAPGSSMPLVQSAFESADGKSYYTLYPLRPGLTTVEVQQLLPYTGQRYTFVKKFYQDAGSVNVGVIPRDMTLTGKGMSNIETDSQRNFSVYVSQPIKAGTEVVWEFSGGTPVPEQAEASGEAEPEVKPVPNAVGRNALIIGPLLLLGFIAVLWFSVNRSPAVKKK